MKRNLYGEKLGLSDLLPSAAGRVTVTAIDEEKGVNFGAASE